MDLHDFNKDEPKLMIGGPRDGETIISEVWRLRVHAQEKLTTIDRDSYFRDSYYDLRHGEIEGHGFRFVCVAYVHESVDQSNWVKLWFGKILAEYMLRNAKVKP